MYIRDYTTNLILIDARTAVDNFWSAKKEKNEVNFVWDEDKNKQYKKSTYDSIEQSIKKNEKIRNDVHKLAQFYYIVAVCLTDNLCDWKATCDGFFGDVSQYKYIHINYLTKYSELWMIDRHTGINNYWTSVKNCKKTSARKRRANA